MPATTRHCLSSRTTFGYKYVFPIMWSVAFGLGTLGLWLNGFKKGTGAAPEFMRWQFLIVWLAGTAFLIWFCRRIKRVEIDERSIYVSNYFDEIAVPLADIDRITESYWTKPKTVTIHLRTQTPAGRRIVFLPKYNTCWGSHPVVAELGALREKVVTPA